MVHIVAGIWGTGDPEEQGAVVWWGTRVLVGLVVLWLPKGTLVLK